MNAPSDPLRQRGLPARLGERDAETAHAALVEWLSSRAALWVAGLWGVAEAAVFFIVPDLGLGLVGLFAPRRVASTLLAITVGAVIGAVILVGLSAAAPADVGSLLADLPGISRSDLATVRTELEAQGLAAFLGGPIQGLPVKLYIHEATLQGLAGPLLLVFVALNRILRVGLFGLVMAILGTVARPLIARLPRVVTAVYLVGWAIFYGAYFAARSS